YNQVELDKKDESNMLIALAPIVEEFIGELFNIRAEVSKSQFAHTELGDLFSAKRLFVQRAAAKLSKPADIAAGFDYKKAEAELASLFGGEFNERNYAHHVVKWMDANDNEKLTLAAHYANWASNTE